MCKSSEINYQKQRLKIKAFYLHLSLSKSPKLIPQTITLHYLPRISGTPLEINGSKIRPDSDAFVTLHRVRSAEKTSKEAVFATRDLVRAGEAVRFQVYVREEKVLKGIFRKDEGGEWKLQCKCVLDCARDVDITEAEVSVVVEGHVPIIQRVDMRRRRRRRRKCWRGFNGLDDIPEEREEGLSELDGCDCCCDEIDGQDCHKEVGEMDMEEGVRWAVDVGIWIMCLGVGYLVSKASSKSLRRRKLIL